jgi:4-hydroxybenzoate polyprenyltransferase
MSSLAKRLWIYQKERFPLGILAITTSAVLASTFAVLEWTGYNDIPLWKYLALGVAGLSFMLHTRVIDEIRDKDVDDVHHPDRPVQRGLVSLRELTVLGYANGGVFICIHALLDPLSGLLSAGLLLYSIVARYEVGPLAWLKPRFWLYNVVMLGQMLLLQWIAYAALTQTLDWPSAIWMHGWGIWALTAQIEVARKCLAPDEETTYRDSYSSRVGSWGSVGILLALTLLALWAFAATGMPLNRGFLAAGLGILLAGAWIYARNPTRSASKLLQLAAVIAYVLSQTALWF